MNAPHLNSLDLNLLRVFEALLEEGSVTRAAQRLGLTQSAVSHALNRLRYALGDELFVRAPDGMRATPHAAEIAPGVLRGMRQLQAAFAPSAFDPATSTRRFTVDAGTYACAVMLPEVVARLRAEAPSVELRIRNAGPGLVETLDAGRADAAIGSFARVPERFAKEPLFEERLVWVMRADHPMADEPLTLDRLCALPHIIIALAEDAQVVDGSVVDNGLERRVIWDDGSVQREMSAQGKQRIVALTVPDSHSALSIVSRTDMVAFVPRRLALAFQPFGLKLQDPPYPTVNGEISLVWRKDQDSAALAWLRSLLISTAAALKASAA
jgi:DNA-binding transcriptional LysR family regulator